MLLRSKFIFSVVLGLFVCSCAKKRDASKDRAVARAYDSYLLAEDVPYEFREDSTKYNFYINEWIKKEVLKNRAYKDPVVNTQQVRQLVQEYQDNLYIEEFLEQKVLSQIDTAVSEEVLSDFYERQNQDYILDKNYYKAVLVRLPKEMTSPKKLDRQISKERFWDKESFIKYLNDKNGKLKVYSTWTSEHQVLSFFPYELHGNFKVSSGKLTAEHKQFIYLIYVIDHVKEGTAAPVDLVRQKIKQRILFERKRVTEQRVIEKLIEDAKNNEYIYNSFD